ncbi:hypothetical protein BC936DRAFT_145560 [Jimgerdemannia flammicorona]|uniref:Uncharacterized protein n=1 Tax=Jimgerdemannia flammicorona TaxID=994334 RepID=A0A433D9Q6_9FUNG|nr:hypothetical protein BC936DRAFT_145560 [Jimgerdemannia flammicorona]
MPKSIPPLPNNLRHKGYWTSTDVESWSIESFDLYWIQQNPRLDRKFKRAHTSLGKELALLLKASDQTIVDKAQSLKKLLKTSGKVPCYYAPRRSRGGLRCALTRWGGEAWRFHSLQVILPRNGPSKIDNIVWDRSEEIANSQVHLTFSEFLAKTNIKINLVDDIANFEKKKRKRKCDDGYDVSFDEFSSSETATAPVSESSEDELTEVALGKRKLEDIEGDEAGGVEPEDQNDIANENNVGDVPASSNDDPEELEDSEIIEFDLESVADELRRAPKVEWNVGAVNVTERFRRYQGEVLKKAKSEGLTYKNIYEVLFDWHNDHMKTFEHPFLSLHLEHCLLCWPCPYPVFTNREWLEITKTNPYTVNEPPLLPEISLHLCDAARRHLAGKDAFLDGGKSGLSRTIARLFNDLYDGLPMVAPLKMSEDEHCYMFLHPITRPFFLGPRKEYKLLLNHATAGSKQRPDFACVVDNIPILASEIKPLGYTWLQQRRDNLKVQLRARKSINQQLQTKGGPGEAAMFTNMGALMESFFMDLKYDGLYRSWPFLTTRLVIDKTTIPLAEFAISHLMALEVYNSVRLEFAVTLYLLTFERVGKIAENYKYRSNEFTPPAQMIYMRELPDSPQLKLLLH